MAVRVQLRKWEIRKSKKLQLEQRKYHKLRMLPFGKNIAKTYQAQRKS